MLARALRLSCCDPVAMGLCMEPALLLLSSSEPMCPSFKSQLSSLTPPAAASCSPSWRSASSVACLLLLLCPVHNSDHSRITESNQRRELKKSHFCVLSGPAPGHISSGHSRTCSLSSPWLRSGADECTHLGQEATHMRVVRD